MGIDALDIVFRLERTFEIKIPRGELFYRDGEISDRHKWFDITIGEIHVRLCELLRNRALPIPSDSWELVTRCIGEALHVPPTVIRPEHRLVEDLGAT